MAYRQFMTDLAAAMTNDTMTISNDVLAMYLFEQSIAKVILSCSIFDYLQFIHCRFIGVTQNNDFEIMKPFEQPWEIFLII